MASRQCAEVIGHSVQVIQVLLVILETFLDVWVEVEARNREVNKVVNLARAKHRVPIVRKALQMNDQIVRCLEDLHFFLCGYVVLALATVPFVIPTQGLFYHKVVKAVIDRGVTGAALLKASRLVSINYKRLLNQLNIRLGLTSPVGHYDQVTIPKAVNHLLERCFVFIAGLKLAIVLVYSVAQLTSLLGVKEHAWDNGQVV